MVERIRQLLEARKLTPTQFADAIGVARPIVSHILSGRNKPSLEVVQKVIEAFPDLSLAWLLRGAGEMLATSPAPADVKPSPTAPSSGKGSMSSTDTRSTRQNASATRSVAEQPATPLFDGHDDSNELLAAPRSSNPVEVVAPAPAIASMATPSAVTTSPSLGPTPTPAVQPPRLEQKEAGAMPASAALAFAEPNKAIRRIVIFYQDGTFTDYRPEA